MRVYDVVIGERLTDVHVKSLYVDRFGAEDVILFPEVINRIAGALTYIKSTSKVDLSAEAEIAISRVIALKDSVLAGSVADPIVAMTRLKELLEILAYFKIEVQLIMRNDLVDSSEPVAPTMAYLINTQDTFIPELSRVGAGWGLSFDTPEHASISDVVMGFLDVISFSSEAIELLDLESQVSKYNSLVAAHSGYLFDITDILSFMNSLGYKVVIVLE